MTCKELYDFLDRYVAGELPEPTAAEFGRHLDDCPPCADYLDSYRKTIDIGRGTLCCSDEVPEAMPDALVRAILDTVRKSN